MDVKNLRALAESALASPSGDDGGMANLILHLPVGTPGVEDDPKKVAQRIIDEDGFAESLSCDSMPHMGGYMDDGPMMDSSMEGADQGASGPQGLRAQVAYACKKHGCPTDVVQPLVGDLLAILKAHGVGVAKAAGDEGEEGEEDGAEAAEA